MGCTDRLVESIEVPLADIAVESQIFDSLRSDYLEFDQWYLRVANEGRKAFVIRTGSGIAAIAIIKEEHEGEAVANPNKTLTGSFLKICTFKVVDSGFKYGESLLLRLFAYAKKNNYTSVYIQVREFRHQGLIDFLTEFGFFYYGGYNEDAVYVKYLAVMDDDIPNTLDERAQFMKKYYPSFDDSSAVRKFIVSVSSEVHDHIFPASELGLLDFHQPMQCVRSEVNAIRKIVIENVGIKSLRKGDLLLFYRKSRSKRGRHVRCAGIVEEIEKCHSLSEVSREVREKLTYTDDDILNLIIKNRYVILISFRMLPEFEVPISKYRLSIAGIETNHRNIRQLSEEAYLNVFRKAFWYNEFPKLCSIKIT